MLFRAYRADSSLLGCKGELRDILTGRRSILRISWATSQKAWTYTLRISMEWVQLHYICLRNKLNFDDIQEIPSSSAKWELLLPRTKTGPHRQHCLQLERTSLPITHVRMTIYPDGGIKRLRLVGRRAVSSSSPPVDRVAKPQLTPDNLKASRQASVAVAQQSATMDSSLPTIPALPLTSEAFAPYGYVIQSYPNTDHVFKGLKVTDANFGSAKKYNHLSPITALPPPAASKNLKHKENFSVYRCTPTQGLGTSAQDAFRVEVLERHEYTSQTFLPLGGGAARYLVIVALPGKEGKPDLKTLRAFTATSAQAFTYKPNVSASRLLLDRLPEAKQIPDRFGITQ